MIVIILVRTQNHPPPIRVGASPACQRVLEQDFSDICPSWCHSQLITGVHEPISSKTPRIEIQMLFSNIFCFFCFHPVLCGTHHTFHNGLRDYFNHAAAYLDRSSFCCLSKFEAMEFRVAVTTDDFVSSCCVVNAGCNSSHFWRIPELHPRNNVYKFEFEATNSHAQFCRWRTRCQFKLLSRQHRTSTVQELVI